MRFVFAFIFSWRPSQTLPNHVWKYEPIFGPTDIPPKQVLITRNEDEQKHIRSLCQAHQLLDQILMAL